MNVFTYGSLMFPEVLEALTGQQFSFEDITLKGFERRAITDKNYPGLRLNEESSIDGRIWFDITDEAMVILDRFEDALYDRRMVELISRTRGRIEARVYVVPQHLESALANGPWDKAHFEEYHLEPYVAMCRRFRKDALGVKEGV